MNSTQTFLMAYQFNKAAASKGGGSLFGGMLRGGLLSKGIGAEGAGLLRAGQMGAERAGATAGKVDRDAFLPQGLKRLKVMGKNFKGLFTPNNPFKAVQTGKMVENARMWHNNSSRVSAPMNGMAPLAQPGGPSGASRLLGQRLQPMQGMNSSPFGR